MVLSKISIDRKTGDVVVVVIIIVAFVEFLLNARVCSVVFVGTANVVVAVDVELDTFVVFAAALSGAMAVIVLVVLAFRVSTVCVVFVIIVGLGLDT